MDFKDKKTKEVAEKIYKQLKDLRIDVLLDDRDDRVGIKFKDADLIGIPFRITISKKTLVDDVVEFKERKDDRSLVKLIKIENIVSTIVEELKKVQPHL